MTKEKVLFKKEEYSNFTLWMAALKNSISPDEANYYRNRIESLITVAKIRNNQKIKQ